MLLVLVLVWVVVVVFVGGVGGASDGDGGVVLGLVLLLAFSLFLLCEPLWSSRLLTLARNDNASGRKAEARR